MTTPTPPHRAASARSAADQGVRPTVLLPLLLVVGVCLAACVLVWTQRHPARGAATSPPQARSETPETAPAAAGGTVAVAEEELPIRVTNRLVPSVAAGKATVTPKGQAVVAALPRAEPSPYTRQLVNSLVNLEPMGVPRTAEQVAAWKQSLQQLVQQGAAALPAIREFLERNVDFAFGSDGANALGYDTARGAMYGALAQIGGPDAAGILLDTLRNTASPQDIALLSRSLDQMAPGQYGPQMLDAARQVLGLPMDGQGSQTDVAPLFDVLAKYGGANAVTELGENAARWKYYSAIALGQLPEGAGVPALAQMVQESGGMVRNVPALQMLTQLAAQNPDARATLLQEVRANAIAPNTWAYLTAALSGDQVHFLDATTGGLPTVPNANDIQTFHIAAGNQNFYTAPPPGGLTAEQLNRQLGLVDELLSATPQPAARQTLQNAREALLRHASPAPAPAAKP